MWQCLLATRAGAPLFLDWLNSQQLLSAAENELISLLEISHIPKSSRTILLPYYQGCHFEKDPKIITISL